MVTATEKPRILTSCYTCNSITGENFISDHALAFQVSGSLKINYGKETQVFKEGSFRLNVRNRLVKFVKQIPDVGEYKSIVITFDQKFLREFSIEKGITPIRKHINNPVIT